MKGTNSTHFIHASLRLVTMFAIFVWALKPRHVTFGKVSADVRAIEMNLLSN